MQKTSLQCTLFTIFAFVALALPVDAAVYYGGYSYGTVGFNTYGGAVVVRPGPRRRYRWGRKLLQDENANRECESMLDIIETRPMLSSLKEAIQDLPKIRDALNNRTATDTFFAPSNAAIESFTKWGGYDDFKAGLSSMFSSDEIKALIVAYHAVPDERLMWGQLRAKAAQGAFLRTALANIFDNDAASLEVSFWKGNIFLKGIGSEGKIVAADIPACGSVVHVVDAVLLPIDGDGELSEEQMARIKRARERGDNDNDEAPAPSSPDFTPAPAPAPSAEPYEWDIIDDGIIDIEYGDESYEAAAPAPAPAPAAP